MAHTFAKSQTPRRLSEVLAESRPWRVKDSLLLVHRLALQVRTLHQNGRTHRAISPAAVSVDEKLRPQLGAPAGPRRFGGEDSDPEFCPPQLAAAEGLELPEGIEAAAAVLKKNGQALDPRRIDVYQLGTLLCRLLIGEPVLGYMYDPTVKAKVPFVARPVLEGALGDNARGPFGDCEELIEALEQAIRQAQSAEGPSSMHETPARGSAIVPHGDTPPKGKQPASAPQSGQLPFERLGQFQIVRQIGSGGMGDVYLGYDESLDRQVAIKVLPAELARDQDFVRRFHAEAAAAAKVAHPNVVPVYFIGEDAGYHFFAMQFIEGESLSQRLARRKRLEVDEAVEVVGECLGGLEAAHARGLIHRDIKPGNILLERETGRAMVVDFGLVRMIGQSTRMTATGMIMGTVDYIAPEQARGHKVDGRADIYSLGVLFYQLLAGRLPFEAETPTAMIFQHAYEEPFPLSEAAPNVPRPVAEIIARMMAKDPEDRYPRCVEVLADLEAYRQGRPLAAAAKPGKRTTTILPAPEPLAEPKLPPGLAKLADNRRWVRLRDWAATIFRRHAPEFVQELQSTTQQVDGAVAHYQRRRNHLARLQPEGRAILRELSARIKENEEAAAAAEQMLESAAGAEAEQAALAKKQECGEHVEALRRQIGEQERQLEEIEHQLGQADATLARLHSQRDVLKARLRAAEARRTMEVGRPRARRLWLAVAAVAAIAAGLIAIVSLTLLLGRPDPALILPEGRPESSDTVESHVEHVRLPADVAPPPETPKTARPGDPSSLPANFAPGLIARLYLGDSFTSPTHLLGIVHSEKDFNHRQAAGEMPDTYSAAQAHLAVQGHIYLAENAEVSFDFDNCLCKVNEKVICAGDGEFTLPMNSGLHEIKLYRPDPGHAGPRFSIRVAQTGGNVLFHNRSMLEAELAKEIRVGEEVKTGILLEGEARGPPEDGESDDPKAVAALEKMGNSLVIKRDREGRITSIDYWATTSTRLIIRPGAIRPGEPTDVPVPTPGKPRFDDDAMQHVRGLPRLEELKLQHSEITDGGLAHLDGLTSLTTLDFRAAAITDAGMKYLGGLHNLKWLSLIQTQITDAGLEHIGRLTALEELYLGETQITDAGLDHLRRLTNLKRLHLHATKVTDAGLASLARLTGLEWVYLKETLVTADGVKRLMAALPKGSIISDHKIEIKTPEDPNRVYLD